MKFTVTLLAALALSAGFSLAQDAEKKGERPQRNPEEIFKKLDTNGDGFISLDEFKAGPMAKRDPSKADEAFKRRDKDGDGKISLEEFKAGRGGKGGEKGAEPAKPADGAK